MLHNFLRLLSVFRPGVGDVEEIWVLIFKRSLYEKQVKVMNFTDITA